MIFDMLKGLLGDEGEENKTESPQNESPAQVRPEQSIPHDPFGPPAAGGWGDPLGAPYPLPQPGQAQKEQEPKRPSLLQRLLSKAPASKQQPQRQAARPPRSPQQQAQRFGGPMRAHPVQRNQQPMGWPAQPRPYRPQQRTQPMPADPFGAPVPRQPRRPRQPMGPWL